MALRRSLCLAWQTPRCKPSKPGGCDTQQCCSQACPHSVRMALVAMSRSQSVHWISIQFFLRCHSVVQKIQHFLLEEMGQRFHSVSGIARVKVMLTDRFFCGGVATFRCWMIVCIFTWGHHDHMQITTALQSIRPELSDSGLRQRRKRWPFPLISARPACNCMPAGWRSVEVFPPLQQTKIPQRETESTHTVAGKVLWVLWWSWHAL